MEHITKAERPGQSKLSHKSFYCISWLLILNHHIQLWRFNKDEERTSSTGSRASHAGTESENALTTDRLLHHIRRVSHNSGVSRNIHVDLVQSASLYHRTTGFVSSFFPVSFRVMRVTTAGSNQHLFVVFCKQLYALRGFKRGSPNPNHNQIKSSSFSSSSLSVSADPMGNNYRPIQPTHHRPVRTNIDFTSSEVRRGSSLFFM